MNNPQTSGQSGNKNGTASFRGTEKEVLTDWQSLEVPPVWIQNPGVVIERLPLAFTNFC
jgi:hypothetical protein